MRWIRPTLAVCVAVAVLAGTGCGGRMHRSLLPDARPEVRLTPRRVLPRTPGTFVYLMSWTASAPGRSIDHFVYAIDPASVDAVDATWVRTTATSQILTFALPAGATRTSEPHVFAVAAVDDQGAMSAIRWSAVAAAGLPPSVRITDPVPSAVLVPSLLPSPTITWQGVDPDGQTTTHPVRYVYRLFTGANPDFPAISDFISFALSQPDSFRRLYAPDFAGWTSVAGDTTSVQYAGLTPGTQYLFAVTGFDEGGDYDPVFSADKNLLRFDVALAGTGGPRLTMFNEFFSYTYPTGGFVNDPARYVPVDAGDNGPVTIHWFAVAAPGASIRDYRWVLDPLDLFDETPRTNELTDVQHWSARSVSTTGATLGPFTVNGPKPQPHLLFIEAEDSYGLVSLGIVRLSITHVSFSNELLFVDDTRLMPDMSDGAGGVLPPTGAWPTAAELDTFLFARGGVPWRGRAPGTLSTPGIFNGYAYDTLGTRGISLDGSVPLWRLGRYRHVVWYTDLVGATYKGPPSDPNRPITALRASSMPGRVSTLSAYVGQGGQVWLSGGGAAFATLDPYNNPANGGLVFDYDHGELQPGRLMYDLAHWQVAIAEFPAVQARRFGSTSYNGGSTSAPFPRPSGRGWPTNPPLPTPPTAPDYFKLADRMNPKTSATDPLPPGRENSSVDFYSPYYPAEFILGPTWIREFYGTRASGLQEFSTLDTLYITAGGSAAPNSPVMTYYHGRECEPFVFSGFNFWYFRRTDCITLVDWVLHEVWGLQRDPSASR